MAKIGDLLAGGRTFSFEFFPPKNDAEQQTLVTALRDLEALQPSFVSVTYRGGRSSRERTRDLVVGMLRTTRLTPMAHLTCVAHSRLELAEILIELRKGGVENLMALGGDPLPDEHGVTELEFAIQLVRLAREIGGFSIGVAAHPQVHPRAADRPADRRYLAEKLELADFGITQFFFRADDYLAMRDDLEDLGVTKPVIPGIMPITNVRGFQRMAGMSGAEVPAEIVARFHGYEEDPASVRAIGVEIACELCQALLADSVPGLHFYTLNRSTATREIYAQLGLQPSPAPSPA
jgi:methylenetetrahydrofolate reductase (NADPH)